MEKPKIRKISLHSAILGIEHFNYKMTWHDTAIIIICSKDAMWKLCKESGWELEEGNYVMEARPIQDIM